MKSFPPFSALLIFSHIAVCSSLVCFLYLLVQKILDTFFDNISDSLKNKRNVEIRSLGVFFIKEIKEKKNARNPKTGEIIYVPKKNKARFKPSKKLKETINN